MNKEIITKKLNLLNLKVQKHSPESWDNSKCSNGL